MPHYLTLPQSEHLYVICVQQHIMVSVMPAGVWTDIRLLTMSVASKAALDLKS
jgi:hypothetical protein